MKTMRQALVGGLLLMGALPAWAEPNSSRQITLVAAFAPGGGVDAIARIVAAQDVENTAPEQHRRDCYRQPWQQRPQAPAKGEHDKREYDVKMLLHRKRPEMDERLFLDAYVHPVASLALLRPRIRQTSAVANQGSPSMTTTRIGCPVTGNAVWVRVGCSVRDMTCLSDEWC